MVRKIGFGNKNGSTKKSVADAYLDKFRARSRAKTAQKEKLPQGPRPEPEKILSWFSILFLTFALFLWTLGIIYGAYVALSGQGGAFLIVWLIFANYFGFELAKPLLRQYRAKSRALTTQNTTPPPNPKPAPKAKRKWLTIIFLTFWLCGWSLGILVAGAVAISGDGGWFILIWLTVAIIGWFAVVAVLIAHLRGSPPKNTWRSRR